MSSNNDPSADGKLEGVAEAIKSHSHETVADTRRVCDKKDFNLLVICGPSGSGKSTLIKRLFKDHPDRFGFSVSHTTRKPRDGEKHGEHYYFTTIDEMKLAIERGEFLETALYSENLYGTSIDAVRQVCKSGKICILDIEIEGVKQIKQTDLNPIMIFIKPPSIIELEKRLKKRGTETEESLERRLKRAKIEMDYGDIEGNFHKIIVNDNLDEAYTVFIDFINTELDRRNSEEK